MMKGEMDMGSEPFPDQFDGAPPDALDRAYVSGREIRRRVQALIDASPALQGCDRMVIAPMPKPVDRPGPTGCNWTMHYRGQFPDCEALIDQIVETVQNDVNIGPARRRRPISVRSA
jgi:hypothetical protein